jgi:shikimate kinase
MRAVIRPESSPSRADRIVLVGFMGAGKTTVGRALAVRLSTAFFDTDALVEAREGRTIEEIFRADGEGYFRERESEALQEALAAPRAVIATGGGLYLAETHQAAIRKRAVSVWLDAPLDVIRARCQGGASRPLFGTPEEIETLLSARRERYALADLRIDSGVRHADELAAEIERRLRAPGITATGEGTT